MHRNESCGNHTGEKAFVEVISEGEHCIPCVYMAKVVEEAVKKFGDRVRWEKVVLKSRPGTERYAALSAKEGRISPIPIPSIFVNGKLAFETIPPVEELEEYLEEALK